MGSRSVLVVCRDADVACRRFGATDGKQGVVYTRTGRPFFPDEAREAAVVERIAAAMAGAGLWERFETDWICLDAELMPWSAKAQALLKSQYAAVGASGTTGLDRAVALLERACARNGEGNDLLERMRSRREMLGRYVDAYRRYCWTVSGIEDLKLAPFHIMATEGAVHSDKDHVWHMETLAELAAQDPGLLTATPYKVISVTEPESEQEGTAWWGSAHRAGRRRHGREGRGLGGTGPSRPRPARRQVPWPRVPPDHLRPRVHRR